MEDSQITALFFERSEDAIKELSEKYGAVFRKQAENVLKNREDAEECLNELYLAVWNSIPPNRPESLLAYGSRILRNLSLDRVRRENALKRPQKELWKEEDPLDQLISPGEVEDEMIAKELEAAIDAFLEGQPRINQMLFVRRYWYLDSYEELARLSGLSQVALRARLSRMRRDLRQFLRKEGVLE